MHKLSNAINYRPKATVPENYHDQPVRTNAIPNEESRPKSKWKVTNWPEYDRALVQRGDVNLNGVQIQEVEYSSANMFQDTKPLLIGAVNGLNRYFNGLIDEARIYNRALTDSEITVLYQQVAKTIKNGVC